MNRDYAQVRVVGDVQEMNIGLIEKLFEKNPEQAELFPDKNGNDNFSVFYLSKGKGEIFDLSGKENNMNRERFVFGDELVNQAGCVITESCVECGECGICYALCSVDARAVVFFHRSQEC